MSSSEDDMNNGSEDDDIDDDDDADETRSRSKSSSSSSSRNASANGRASTSRLNSTGGASASASARGRAGRTSYMTDNERRAHHNALERRRRDHIKESFSRLRESVPTLRGEKMSRAQVLRKASEYILHMRRRYQLFQGDIDQLKHQNDSLEDEIRRVETAIANGIDPSTIPTNFAAFDTPIKTDPDSPNDLTDSPRVGSVPNGLGGSRHSLGPPRGGRVPGGGGPGGVSIALRGAVQVQVPAALLSCIGGGAARDSKDGAKAAASSTSLAVNVKRET